MLLESIHHIAIIVRIMKVRRIFIQEFSDWKLFVRCTGKRGNLINWIGLNGQYIIELFHFLIHLRDLSDRKVAACDTLHFRSAILDFL